METTMTIAQLLSALALEGKKENEAVQQPYDSNMSPMEAVRAAVERARHVPEYIQRLEAAMPHILEFYESIADNKVIWPDESGVIKGKNWKEIMDEIRTGLYYILDSSKDLKAIRIVCLELIKYKFRDGITQSQAERAIGDCFSSGFFVTGNEGGIMVGKRRIIISDNFGLTDADKKEIASIVQKAFAPKENETPKKPVPATKPKRTNTDKITIREAWKGNVGIFELQIPTAEGTKLLKMQSVDSVGGVVFVLLSAFNGLKDIEGQSIPLSALKDRNGKVNQDHIGVVFPENQTETQKERITRLGLTLLKGFQFALEERHDIDPKEFFTTDVVGDSVLTYRGTFEWRPNNDDSEDRDFEDLTLRFHRGNDEKITLTEILSEEAMGFQVLKTAVGKSCSPGQAFKTMKPFFCRLFLQATYGQVVQRRYEN